MIIGLTTSAVRNAVGGLCLALVILCGLAGADEPDFDYDIFLVNDTLTLWIDITPALSQSKMEDLVSGLDISVQIDIDVVRPRPLIFSTTIASAKSVLVISRDLTRDTYRLLAAGTGSVDRTFKNQLILSDFLADSLEIPVTAAEDLGGQDVRLDINLVSKSHSNNTKDEFARLREGTESGGAGDGGRFFESLFSAFLELVGFGADAYDIKTPLFSPDELPAF